MDGRPCSDFGNPFRCLWYNRRKSPGTTRCRLFFRMHPESPGMNRACRRQASHRYTNLAPRLCHFPSYMLCTAGVALSHISVGLLA